MLAGAVETGKGEALMCTGPSLAPAALPPSPPSLELSGANGSDYGGGGCQMLASRVLPRLFSPLPLGPQGLWGRGKAERQSGCLDLRVQEQGSNEQSVF